MNNADRLPLCLLTLRLSVFLVMLVWTLDKFFAPTHAASVFEHFYFIGGLRPNIIYIIGIVEFLLIVAFVLGMAKRLTYGAVFLLHGVSTLVSFPMYLTPSQGRLFYAAWPMLAASFTLYLLRDSDTFWTIRAFGAKETAPP